MWFSKTFPKDAEGNNIFEGGFLGLEANDDAQKLARGLRAALDKINVKR